MIRCDTCLFWYHRGCMLHENPSMSGTKTNDDMWTHLSTLKNFHCASCVKEQDANNAINLNNLSVLIIFRRHIIELMYTLLLRIFEAKTNLHIYTNQILYLKYLLKFNRKY